MAHIEEVGAQQWTRGLQKHTSRNNSAPRVPRGALISLLFPK